MRHLFAGLDILAYPLVVLPSVWYITLLFEVLCHLLDSLVTAARRLYHQRIPDSELTAEDGFRGLYFRVLQGALKSFFEKVTDAGLWGKEKPLNILWSTFTWQVTLFVVIWPEKCSRIKGSCTLALLSFAVLWNLWMNGACLVCILPSSPRSATLWRSGPKINPLQNFLSFANLFDEFLMVELIT